MNEFQVDEKNRVISEAQRNLREDFSNTISPMFKVILFLNNFYKCLQYSGETKDFCEEKIQNDDMKKRIDNIFLNELNKGKIKRGKVIKIEGVVETFEWASI